MAENRDSIRIVQGGVRKWVPETYWEPYKSYILDLIDEGKKNEEIIQIMREQNGEDMKMHQLKEMRKKWGFSKRNLKPNERQFIYAVFHERRSRGEASAFRWTDTQKDIDIKQIDRIIKDQKNALDTGSTTVTCSSVEVYTPEPAANDPEETPEVNRPNEILQPYDPNVFGYQNMLFGDIDVEFTEFDPSQQGIGTSENLPFLGDFEELAGALPVPREDVVIGNMDLTPDLMETCEGIRQAVERAQGSHGEDDMESYSPFLHEYTGPRSKYKKDLDRWISDMTHKAGRIVEQVKSLQLANNIGEEEAFLFVKEQWSEATGTETMPYDHYLSILASNDELQQETPAAKALHGSRFVDWNPILMLYDKYYDKMEEFTQKYFFKVSFAMRIAHLPFLQKEYGPLHFFTIRALYAFNQVLRFITNDPAELTPVAEVLTFSYMIVGGERYFQGSRSFLRLIRLYESDMSGDRPAITSMLSLYFKAREIPKLVTSLDQVGDHNVRIMMYLHDGGDQFRQSAIDAQGSAAELLYPIICSRSFPPGYTNLVFESLQQLGRGYLYLKQPVEAIQLSEEALRGMGDLKQSFGAYFGNFMYGVHCMAQGFRQLRNYTAALKILQISIDWHIEMLGLGHSETMLTIELATEVMTERGLTMYATPILEKAGIATENDAPGEWAVVPTAGQV